MTDYFHELRRTLIRKITLSFILIQLLVLVSMALVYMISPWRSLFFSIAVFLAAEILLFLLFLNIIKKSLEKQIGSQAAISRTLFKNTRNIINNISHEWRTPLNAIMGFTDELYAIESDEHKREALKAVRSNSERLYSMSKKLIDFSSIETGLYRIDLQFQSVDALLMNLRSKYEDSALEKKLSFEMVNEVPDNLRINFDFHAMFEILAMLVENAIKFTQEGSVSLRAAYKKSRLEFSVCDTGIGVDEDKKGRVFDLYQQGNTDLDREFEGIGMGLTIAGKLVEMHRGFIILEDNEPRGTCVHLTFKTISKESTPQNSSGTRARIVPDGLNSGQKEMLLHYALELQDFVKVFDPGKIKTKAEELYVKDRKFEKLRESLKAAADNFDETGFASIVEEMLEGSK